MKTYALMLKSMFGKILWLSLLFTLPAWAGSAFTEYLVGVSARSYPVGGSAMAQASYGQLLWGEKSGVAGEKASTAYGFYRVIARVQSSLTVNTGLLSVDLYPISFLGINAGVDASHRSADFSGINCTIYTCQSSITRAFASINGVLGVSSFYVGYAVRATRYQSSKNTAAGFYDEDSSVAASRSSDTLISVEAWPGVAITPNYRVGLYYMSDRFSGSHQYDESLFLYGSYRSAPHTLGLGLGAFQSTLQSRGFSAFATYRHTWGEAPNLF